MVRWTETAARQPARCCRAPGRGVHSASVAACGWPYQRSAAPVRRQTPQLAWTMRILVAVTGNRTQHRHSVAQRAGAGAPGDEHADIVAADTDQADRAARKLGVAVPPGFQLLEAGPDGRYTAFCAGTANDLRITAAILNRLNGATVNECWTSPAGSSAEQPLWAPPDDLSDQDALLAYLAEQRKHPEWPQAYAYNLTWDTILTWLAGGGSFMALKSVEGIISNTADRSVRTLLQRLRPGARAELTRDDAILVAEHTLVGEFTRLDVDPPNVDSLARKVSQVKDGSWEVLFYGTQFAAQVTVPADEGHPPHVLLLPCHHGIGGQQHNH